MSAPDDNIVPNINPITDAFAPVVKIRNLVLLSAVKEILELPLTATP